MLTYPATQIAALEGRTLFRLPVSPYITYPWATAPVEPVLPYNEAEAVQKINQAAKQISANNTPPKHISPMWCLILVPRIRWL